MKETAAAALGSLYLSAKGLELRFRRRLDNAKLQLLGLDSESEDKKFRELITRLERLQPQKTPYFNQDLLKTTTGIYKKDSGRIKNSTIQSAWCE
jgi:hypothetical protein